MGIKESIVKQFVGSTSNQKIESSRQVVATSSDWRTRASNFVNPTLLPSGEFTYLP